MFRRLKLLFLGTTIIGVIFLFILSAIFQAVIGDITISIFHVLLDGFIKTQESPLLFWLLLLSLIAGGIGFFFYYRAIHTAARSAQAQYRLIYEKLEMRTALFAMEEASLRLLPGLFLASRQGTDDVMHRLIKKMLVDAIRVLPHVYAASFFLPDVAREELRIWESHEVSAHNVANIVCYIGPLMPNRRTGVAGEAFLGQEILIAHKANASNENGNWVFDRESYINLIDSGISVPCQALACVPLYDQPGGRQNSLGVVCFDSLEKDAFDAPDSKENLKLIGRCFTSILLVYHEIQVK